ncbi:helix-turn-helix domain-containing protein (plasmid) [Falsihalocynthiibacter sp. SS001]|uniref:helix-turn-helix domain-containing protein n=1 Tax=Falsihalocynthiibacter sp. SS001 TaxID=3349698 RepID=UPI0036D3E5F5
MPKSLPLVQLQLLAPLINGLRTYGVDPESVLTSVGLTMSAVEKKGSSVHVMVMHQFVERCAEVTGDHTFGASIGSQLDPTGWPMIRLAFEKSSTLGDFLNVYVSQASLVASSVTAYADVRGDIVTFGEDRRFEPLIVPAQNDGFMIGLKVTILERLLGHRMDPEQVILVLCDPSVLPSSFTRFHVLRGNRMGPRIRFPSEWLSWPISGGDTTDDFTDMVAKDRNENFLNGFRSLLNLHIGNGGLKAGEAANLLHLDTRKLARQLAEIGTSISKELSRAKITYAKEALNDGDRSIEEIAFELGYSDPSNFTRAFTKEEGINPSQYRLLD